MLNNNKNSKISKKYIFPVLTIFIIFISLIIINLNITGNTVASKLKSLSSNNQEKYISAIKKDVWYYSIFNIAAAILAFTALYGYIRLRYSN